MTRSSRHKSHKKRRDSGDYSSDSENEGSAGYGHGKGRSSKQEKSEKSKERVENEGERKNRGSVSMSDERWEGGGENALSLLAYLDHSKEREDSRADSDSSYREENQKSRRHKSKQFTTMNGGTEIKVSSNSNKRKETLEAKDRGKDDTDFRGSKSKAKFFDGDVGRKEAVDSNVEKPKKENFVRVLPGADPLPWGLEGTSTEMTVAVPQTANANEDSSLRLRIRFSSSFSSSRFRSSS